MIKYYIVIKHSTYLREPISKGTTACTKSIPEVVKPRADCQLKINMSRLTNPSYNFLAGSEVPKNISSVRNYVVFFTLDKLNMPATSSRHKKGSSKLITRQKQTEFGMIRNGKPWGSRKARSTKNLLRKEPTYVSLEKTVLSGTFESKQLKVLKSNIISNKKCTNLSIIMSDPNFLIAAWVKIKSKSGSLTPALNKDTLDEIELSWFEETANTMRNGKFQFSPSRRIYTPKPNGKKRPLTIPSPKDKIVQEAMRFLLLLIFEGNFNEDSHGWVTNRGCHTALNQIKMQFNHDNWFIEGELEQQFPTLNHEIIVNLLKQKIEDQAFIDLIYKYLRVGYGEKPNSIIPMKIGTSQRGVLSPILANIYMTPFDNWVKNYLKPKYNIGKRKKTNPLYTKMIRNGKVTDHSIQSTHSRDNKFLRLHYVRYADDFIMGLNGPKIYCKKIVEECNQFLNNELKLTLNLEKIKITHSQKESATFLGHTIHRTKFQKMKIDINSTGKKTRRTTNTVLDGPIEKIVRKLHEKGYAKKNGNPTRNGRFINHNLYDMIQHYKEVERGILQYYSLANNYGRVAARVHYILKYSCALTIASKMKLSTLRRVFKKHGKDLNVKDKHGNTITNYPVVSYKRPKKIPKTSIFDYSNLEDHIDKLDNRMQRGRKDLKGPCILCGSKKRIEVHHIRKLSKSKKKDYLSTMMVRMNRKQVPICQKCHIKIHKGTYDGKKVK